jgi:hypothetical protein
MVQWVLRVIMEAELIIDLARSCLGATDAFGDLERPCINTALEAKITPPNPPLRCAIHKRGVSSCGTTTALVTSSSAYFAAETYARDVC